MGRYAPGHEQRLQLGFRETGVSQVPKRNTIDTHEFVVSQEEETLLKKVDEPGSSPRPRANANTTDVPEPSVSSIFE